MLPSPVRRMPALALTAAPALALAVAALLPPPLAAQDLPGPLVSVAWLEQNLGSPGLVVVQVGGDEDDFARAHLPGARFLALSGLAVSRGEYGEAGSLRLELPEDLSSLEATLEAAGISDDSRVVVAAADARRTTSATRTLWTLQYLGLEGRAGLLDGGLAAWRDAGLPVARGPDSGPVGSFSAGPDEDLLVDRAWMAEHLDAPDVSLVDGRRSEAYTGAREEIPGRAGHLPGAGNLPIEDLFAEDGRMKAPGELRNLLAQAGVEDGDTVVAYCHIGLRATALVLAARLAGYGALLYDGSMVDWAMDGDLPLVAGPDPR